jgi:uncharacterized membrane protein (UPF0182 family)
LTVYVTPSGQNINGPVMADAQIQQNTKVSSIITPLDQHGSNVLLGNILMVPINQSMLYIRPLYVTSSGNPLPQLKYVIAVFGSHVDIESSLSVALSNVLSASVDVNNGGAGSGGSGGTGTTSPQAAQAAALLSQAQVAYNQAQASLKAGDLAGYQSSIQLMYEDILAAQQLLTVSSPSQTTTPTSTATTVPVTTTTTSKATKTGTATKAVPLSRRGPN